MFGLPPNDAWLVALLAINCAAYAAAAVWSRQLEHDRPIVLYSVGFSLAFSLLALLAGVALFR